jgi:hypothetical protein
MKGKNMEVIADTTIFDKINSSPLMKEELERIAMKGGIVALDVCGVEPVYGNKTNELPVAS